MIKTFSEAVEYLESLIPAKKASKFPGLLGLQRQKYLMNLLGNPQDKYPTIHITGTSGKGSTAYLISSILTSAGYKVGLHISPHLISITERIQINNENLKEKKFVDLVNRIIPYIEKTAKSKYGIPTYFEVLVALAFQAFYEEKVDLAVIEVGMGGKYDGTNVIKKPLVSVITNVGLDHTQVLGDTVEKITRDKKDIIKKNSQVVSGARQKSVIEIIEGKCNKEGNPLHLLNRDFSYKVSKLDNHGSIFSVYTKHDRYLNLNLKLLGLHQVENASLAVMASELLNNKGFKIKKTAIKDAFGNAYFPGRLEIVKRSPLIIYDGAHNVDKIKAMVGTIPKIFSYKKLIVVFALKRGKDAKAIFSHLTRIADHIILTKFSVGADTGLNLSFPPKKLQQILFKKFNFKNVEIINPAAKALKKALTMQKDDNLVLVTGSLYLIAELKKSNSIEDHATPKSTRIPRMIR